MPQPGEGQLALVTGGAGFLGINLIRDLVRQGYRVRSLDLAPFDYPDICGQIDIVTGDVRDTRVVRDAMTGVDVVVHGAAALPRHAPRDIHTTEVDGTATVLEAARDRGVERVVHVSSTAVYGIAAVLHAAETAPVGAAGAYAEAKWLAEERCRRYRARGGCVAILRPKTFIGPERLGIFSLLYQWIRDGRDVPIIGAGTNRYQLLDVQDLCDAISLCLTCDPEIANDDFNVGADAFGTVREDLQALLDYAGFNRRVRPLPAAPVIGLLRVLERLRLSPMYGWLYETAAKDSVVSVEKAKARLGFAPHYSNRAALIRSYRWFVGTRPEATRGLGLSHRTAWRPGALALAKRFF